MAENRENVVVLVLDCLRKDSVSPYNTEVDFTESIEGFAEEAKVFENVVAQAPWTLPSHASMFTGMYPWEHGATQKNLDLDVESELLAEKYAEKGYETGCYTINGFLNPESGLTDGFSKVKNLDISDRFSGINKAFNKLDSWLASTDESYLRRKLVRLGERFFGGYGVEPDTTEKILDRGKSFVEQSDDNFFLFMNLMDAHEPYKPEEEYVEKHGGFDTSEICQNTDNFYHDSEAADFDVIRGAYNASVDYMDDQIGEFFDWMKEQGVWEDTTVVVTSDHGQMLGEEGFYGHQYSVHRHLTSVPLIVKSGNIERKEDELLELRQLYDLIPKWSGDNTETSEVEVAKGGYEFPDFMIHRVPKERKKEFYRKLRFAQDSKGKLIEEEDEDGNKAYREEGEVQDRPRLRKEIEGIGESSEGEKLKDKDEEIKNRLQDLGYG
jgi:arylsulfatase A-like enzyme